MMKNILIIGSGGREHALARAFEKSPSVAAVYVAPGNPGMELDSRKISCLPIGAVDKESLAAFAREKQVTYTIVGPETSLEVGVVDHFRTQGLQIVGPTQLAVQIESSKIFAKKLMSQAAIPTARFQDFRHDQLADAQSFVQALPLPIVIKESGLAAGKGVYICDSYELALEVLREAMAEKRSDIVVEEFLEGPEFSHFSLINEDHIIPLGIARDYKRAHDGDKGLNTGGMGAISPVSPEDSRLSEEIITTVVRPLIIEMKKLGMPYTGILYTGLMQTRSGLKVIEFNARFGDPETQILLPLIETDWMDILASHFSKKPLQLGYAQKQSLGVVVAAQGYPRTTRKGFPLHLPVCPPGTSVYYSGVAGEAGELTAVGGRLFMVTAQMDSLEQCRKQVYAWLDKFECEHSFYRKDIGMMNLSNGKESIHA